jgi:excisionase family DNA binding protein
VDGQLLYKPEQAAARLGIGRAKLYELMGRGEIDSVQIGRARRISARALEEFVQHLEQPQPAA